MPDIYILGAPPNEPLWDASAFCSGLSQRCRPYISQILYFQAPESTNLESFYWWGHFDFKFFFWRNFEVKQIFCHYCEPHDLCVSDWPNVFFLCKLWNSMDKLLEIGAAKNGFHENDVEHWLWIEIWSRMSNNNIRFRNHLLMDMALPLLEFFVLLQKRRNPNDISRETILCGTIFVKKPNHSLILNHI